MKLFASVLMVLLATTLLSGCGDGPCDAGFSFKYCLNQSSSSSSAPTYTIGGTVVGLESAQSITLMLNRPAVSFSLPTSDPASFPGSGTVGWSFSVGTSKSISYLGLYNTQLTSNTIVGIWNSSGQLLFSGIFPVGLDGIDTTDLDQSGFLWLPVDYKLAPGQYTIGAYSTANHFGVYTSTPVVAYDLSLGAMSLYGINDSMIEPTESISNIYSNGFFGPNLMFSTQKIISTDGYFTFDAPFFSSELYTINIFSQPAGATCKFVTGSGEVISSVSGKINGNNITDVVVACTQNSAG